MSKLCLIRMPDRTQTRGKLPRQLIAPLGTSGWLVELGRTFGLVAGIAERAVSLMTTVLNLGGTIALTYDDDVPVTLSAAELLGESDAEMVDLDPVQSNGLSWAHLLAVRHELLSIVAAGASDAVLITGTDTVEDVGNFLHLTAPPSLRIALVCSLDTATRGQRAPGIEAALTWLRSGADANLQLFVDGNAYSVPFGCLCVCQVAGRGVVEWLLAGPGSDLSEELVVGVEPAALDCRVVPGCPPGFAAPRRSSVIMVRQMWSARRRFRHRRASRAVLPWAILAL